MFPSNESVKLCEDFNLKLFPKNHMKQSLT